MQVVGIGKSPEMEWNEWNQWNKWSQSNEQKELQIEQR